MPVTVPVSSLTGHSEDWKKYRHLPDAAATNGKPPGYDGSKEEAVKELALGTVQCLRCARMVDVFKRITTNGAIKETIDLELRE